MRAAIPTLAAGLMLALAAPARPDCSSVSFDSDFPIQLNLVGTTAGVPDALGETVFVLYDITHTPVPDCELSIDFDGCTGIRLASVQPWAGVTVECGAGPVGVLKAVSDEFGRVTLRVVGGASNTTSGSPANAFACAIVTAGPMQGVLNVGAFDQNGGGGATPADVSVWLADAFDGDVEGRSDYNGSGTVSPADLAVLLGVILAGGSTQSASAYCH
jgi:hypothetical protein